jgi:hypothetical protein
MNIHLFFAIKNNKNQLVRFFQEWLAGFVGPVPHEFTILFFDLTRWPEGTAKKIPMQNQYVKNFK